MICNVILIYSILLVITTIGSINSYLNSDLDTKFIKHTQLVISLIAMLCRIVLNINKYMIWMILGLIINLYIRPFLNVNNIQMK